MGSNGGMGALRSRGRRRVGLVRCNRKNGLFALMGACGGKRQAAGTNISLADIPIDSNQPVLDPCCSIDAAFLAISPAPVVVPAARSRSGTPRGVAPTLRRRRSRPRRNRRHRRRGTGSDSKPYSVIAKQNKCQDERKRTLSKQSSIRWWEVRSYTPTITPTARKIPPESPPRGRGLVFRHRSDPEFLEGRPRYRTGFRAK